MGIFNFFHNGAIVCPKNDAAIMTHWKKILQFWNTYQKLQMQVAQDNIVRKLQNLYDQQVC